jgi:hypothetical protein
MLHREKSKQQKISQADDRVEHENHVGAHILLMPEFSLPFIHTCPIDSENK